MRTSILLGGLVAGLLALPNRLAHADALQVTPTRALGMGGALRGLASGSSAPVLNPSGISLVRSYVVEGAYQYLDAQQGHLAHVAIADSTSASNIGGGLAYTYASAAPSGLWEGAEKLGRHEIAASLSFPFGDKVALGASARYLRSERTLPGAIEVKTSGFTFDAGLTLRPVERISLGAVAYGLRDLKDPQAPAGFGGGLAVIPIPDLVVAADVVVDRRTYAEPADNVLNIGGGAEYTFASRFGLRAGGGRDGLRKGGFGTLGATALSEAGAVDLAGRIDFSGPGKAYILGLSLRLFVPTP